MGIDIEAGVEISLGQRMDRLSAAMDELRDAVRHPERFRADCRAYRLTANCSTTSAFTGSGPIGMLIGKPPAGRLWLVQWVSVFVGTTLAAGTTANLNVATMTGRCPVGESAVQAGALPESAINVGDVVIPTQAVPNTPTGTPDIVVVKPEEALYLLLGGSGLAASTTYNAVASVVDVPDVPGSILYA